MSIFQYEIDEYNETRSKLCITIKNIVKQDPKSQDKIVGAGILSFIHTKNNITLNRVFKEQLYKNHYARTLPHKIDIDFCKANNITSSILSECRIDSKLVIEDYDTVKNDFSSVEIVAKQITDIEFRKSANENSYYDIVFPNILYLNQEDWNKIIGI